MLEPGEDETAPAVNKTPQSAPADESRQRKSINAEPQRCVTYPDERIAASAKARSLAFSREGQSACLSEGMAKEIKAKAEVRSQRADDPSNHERVRSFRAHRYRVKTARAYVDSSSPLAPKHFYINANFNKRLSCFARIERENTIMLRHLAEIIHGKGLVDNHLQKNMYTNNPGQVRQMKLLRITFDNLNLLRRIQSQKPFYSRKKQLEDYMRMEKAMKHMSCYPLYWQLRKECGFGQYEAKAKTNALYRPRPRVFLALGNATEFLGKVVFELYATECPLTAENFRGLCTGEYGPSYKCSTIHRVIPDLLWQGGDMLAGSRSIYGDSFPDENFKVKHEKPGTLTMANCGPNSNKSQFIITAKKLPVLNGTNVAFGKVISGMGVLKQLTNKVTSSGKPKKKVFIIDCGELDGDEDANDDEENQAKHPEESEGDTITEQATYTTDEEQQNETQDSVAADG